MFQMLSLDSFMHPILTVLECMYYCTKRLILNYRTRCLKIHMYSSRHQLLRKKKYSWKSSQIRQTSLSNEKFSVPEKKIPSLRFYMACYYSTRKICNLAFYYFIPSSCLFHASRHREADPDRCGVTVELHMNLFVKISYHQLLRCFMMIPFCML